MASSPKYSWTQPACEACFEEINPGRRPGRIVAELRESELCCYCGGYTRDGIYVRVNPEVVKHATLRKK